jgi:hypothetical protein
VVQRGQDGHSGAHQGRVASADGDRCGDPDRDRSGAEAMVGGVAAKPDRQLRAHGEQQRQRPVDLQRVEPEAMEAG